MTDKPFQLFVIQGRGQRDYADAQAAVAHVPARLISLPFIADEEGMISALRDAGIHIVLDDFGTGNSSLHHIREYVFDRVKIDGSFVRGMSHSEGDAALVHAIASLSRALGLTVTAEGIEDATMIDTLIAEGCDQGQGFSFGGPMSAAEARRRRERDRVDDAVEPAADP